MAAKVAVEMLEVLAYLHSQQFNHGAICAENIWLGDDLKLLDTGIAGMLSAIQGQPIPTFDPQPDLYELGQVLLRSLFGTKAFTDNLDLPSRLLSFQQRLATLPAQLQYLLIGLCSPDSNHHFKTAAEALAGLQNSETSTISNNNLSTPLNNYFLPQIELQEMVRQRETRLAQARVQLGSLLDLAARAQAHWEIAAILLDKSEFVEAQDTCRQGLAELANTNLRAEQVLLLSKQVEIFNWLGDNEQGLHLIELELLPKLAQLGTSDSLVTGQAKVSIAKIYQALGKHAEVKELTSDAVALFQKTNYTIGIADALMVQSFSLNWAEEKPTEAIQLLEEVKILCQQALFGEGFVRCINLIGGCYWNLNDFARVHDYFEQALDYAQKLEMRHHSARLSLNLAITEHILKHLDRSFELFYQAMDFSERIGLKGVTSHSYAGMTEALIDLGRLDEAAKYGRRALRYVQEYPDKKTSLEIAHSYASALFGLGKLEESQAVIKAELESNANNTRWVYFLLLQSLLGRIYLKQGNREAAQEIATIVKAKSETIKNTEALIDANSLQLEIRLHNTANKLEGFDLASAIEQVSHMLEETKTAAPYYEIGLLIIR
jgi:tetratricopeptide (TPR) repeat protein